MMRWGNNNDTEGVRDFLAALGVMLLLVAAFYCLILVGSAYVPEVAP